MQWAYLRGRCITLTDSQVDVLADILIGIYKSLQLGLVTMTPSELVDFNGLCDEAGLSVAPLLPETLQQTRRM